MNITTCLIPLTQGQSAIVSPEDYDFLMRWKWYANKRRTSVGYNWYAVRTEVNPNRMFLMHRVVAERAGLPYSRRYDHRNRDGLCNTRENIRACNQSQNVANSTKRAAGSSSLKGVGWQKSRQLWRARIMVNGKDIFLGRFEDEVDAHSAYAAAAIRYFGEFANP